MRKYFNLIARLCCLGSIKPIPPLVLGRYSVLLALGSLVENCQICLKIFDSICFKKYVAIGKTLLKKVIFESIKVFNNIAFPFRDRCLLES